MFVLFYTGLCCTVRYSIGTVQFCTMYCFIKRSFSSNSLFRLLCFLLLSAAVAAAASFVGCLGFFSFFFLSLCSFSRSR